MSKRLFILALAPVFAAPFAGCAKKVNPVPIADIKKDYDKPLAPGQWGLRKCDPSEYPNFGDAYYSAKGPALHAAVERSINYMGKPSSRKYYPSGEVSHDQVVSGLRQFLQVLDQCHSPSELDAAIRRDFDVYTSVGCDDQGTVLFTGYYSPIFDGSLTQTDKFKYPIYKLPPGYQKDAEGNPVGGRWKTRHEIEAEGALKGNELAYVPDPFEAYVMTVQGSGFLKLPDGRQYEVGYSGHNGYDYTSIGKLLIADGKIQRSQLSLDTMIRYFHEHPEDLDHYVGENKRYVFFQESKGGPYGCLAEVVSPLATIATDKEIFPRASLAFVDTKVPRGPGGDKRTYRSFVLDQDRGAAIRAPGRCDIYMGVGDAAGKMAGGTYNEGRLYYLVARHGGASPIPGGSSPTPPREPGQKMAKSIAPQQGRQNGAPGAAQRKAGTTMASAGTADDDTTLKPID